MLKPYMVLDIGEGQEQLDSLTQSYGNPVEAEMIVYLVQFIHERAKVPFNRKSEIYDMTSITKRMIFACILTRNRDYNTI